jgi:hypothetical protein
LDENEWSRFQKKIDGQFSKIAGDPGPSHVPPPHEFSEIQTENSK